MSAVGLLLRQKGPNLMFWCPACRNGHVVDIVNRGWRWDGNAEKPTITPSYLEFTLEHEIDGVTYPRETVCHLFVTAGMIQYLGDSRHSMKGQTVPMEPIPADYVGLED